LADGWLLVSCAGGCGKTTLATVMFKRLAPGFSHKARVYLPPGASGNDTGQQVAAALEQLGFEPDRRGGAPDVGDLQAFVTTKRVLFVLDNVETAGQLDALLPTKWGKGSVVIITSRSQNLLHSLAWRKVCAFLCARTCCVLL
jgi:hypothetical protein